MKWFKTKTNYTHRVYLVCLVCKSFNKEKVYSSLDLKEYLEHGVLRLTRPKDFTLKERFFTE